LQRPRGEFTLVIAPPPVIAEPPVGSPTAPADLEEPEPGGGRS
jgi:hypothetical protein